MWFRDPIIKSLDIHLNSSTSGLRSAWVQGKPRILTISTPPSSTSSYRRLYTLSLVLEVRGCHQNPVNLKTLCYIFGERKLCDFQSPQVSVVT